MASVTPIASHPRYQLVREPEWSCQQAAQQLGISVKTLKRWAKKGLPHWRDARGYLRFSPSQVDSWLKSKTEVSA